MRQTLSRLLLWGVLASFVANLIYVAVSLMRAKRDSDGHGLAAASLSLWSFLLYTLVGGVVIASLAFAIRRLWGTT